MGVLYICTGKNKHMLNTIEKHYENTNSGEWEVCSKIKRTIYPNNIHTCGL